MLIGHLRANNKTKGDNCVSQLKLLQSWSGSINGQTDKQIDKCVATERKKENINKWMEKLIKKEMNRQEEV